MERKLEKVELPYEVKVWLLSAVAGLLAIDGIIVKDEMGFVEDFNNSILKNEPELQEKLASYMIEREIPELEDIKLNNIKELFFIIDMLINTIYADKLIHPKESDYLIKVGEKMGLKRENIEERVRIESLAYISGNEFISNELKKWHEHIGANYFLK